ncbi:MAG TPA: alpha-L-fucosidase [Blastocatellia bacterium]|nr:alpha-L-fucosidase [Blastocatellia bacterium]
MITWSRFRALFVCLIIAAVITPENSTAQSQYDPTPENLEARKWFQDAKFGLFIHWGVYSVLGDGEWVMNNRKIPISEYENLPARFNPTEFDPAEWVALAKAAGMKYITITSKHHDGFAMFDSKISDWNIVDRTPYKKDVMKSLADECHKQGIKLFFYYSQLDWHHPDYFPRGRTGLTAGRPESGEWLKYIDYMDGQLKELLTNYGPIGGIWFDGMWDRPKAEWRIDQTYRLIHSLQPAAMVGSNHHLKPFPGEDFQMFEKDLPGQKTAGFNAESEVGNLPLETCETINGAWGYNANDKRFKSAKDLIHYLVKAAGYNANFLLNVGPMPNGKIQPEFADRLKQVGAWLEKNGETIYGTRGGPITPRPWGVTTRKGNKVYLHILNWQDQVLSMPKMPKKVKSATFFKDGGKVEFLEHDKYGLFIRSPQGFTDENDTIVVLELAEK